MQCCDEMKHVILPIPLDLHSSSLSNSNVNSLVHLLHMEISFQVFYALACTLLITWTLIELVRTRKRTSERREDSAVEISRPMVSCPAITAYCSVFVSTVYVGFCCFKGLKQEHLSLEIVFLAVTWTSVSIHAVYYRQKAWRSCKMWPLVLVVGWTLLCLHNLLTNSALLIQWLKKDNLPAFSPAFNVVNLSTLPLIVLLGFSIILTRSDRRLLEIEQSLLSKEDAGNRAVRGYSAAGLWSKLVFWWLNPVFEEGRDLKLELAHIPAIPESETAEISYFALQESLHRLESKSFSLTSGIIIAVWKPLAVNALFAGINTLSSYVGPLLINNLVEFLSGTSNHESKFGFTVACLIFLAKTVESLSQRQWYFGARRIGIRVRASLMAFIYNKSLSVKHLNSGGGNIMSLLDVDAERIGEFSWYFHSIWLLPVQVLLALIIMYMNLGGAPTVAALATTMIVIISNIPLASLQKRQHSRIMASKDSRIKATAESLKCIRILKLHSWENIHLNRILQLREQEKGWLKKYLYTCSAVVFLFWASPIVVSVATFGVCIITKTPLTPGVVLSALATFKILQDPIYNLPELVSVAAQTKVSIDRIQDFIKKGSYKRQEYDGKMEEDSDMAVEIAPGEYAWQMNLTSRIPAVRIDSRIKIKKGDKVAVCGQVGSGKSSFLCSIIGEMPKISGAEIKVFGSKAYVPQSSWIQTGTIRENILFGKKMDKGAYNEVVEGCALARDFELWTEGDMTLVGERGVNLSGGQKQRIQMARALYNDADIYLLDDPFSAVDAHTGGHLFKECLLHHLSKKTVIYVTHQLEFLETSDLVLVMRDGRIVQQGKYKDLILDSNGELARQMAAHMKSVSQVSLSFKHHIVTDAAGRKEHQEPIEELSHQNRKEKDDGDETEAGRVKWKVYSTFVTTAFKGSLVPLILFCQTLFQGLQIGSNYWITWGIDREERISREKLIGVFVLLSLGSSICVLGRAVLLSTVAIETSQRLFINMTKCVFRAPISFYDLTPSSRIINRSSADQSVLDTDIPFRVGGLAFALIQLLCIIVLMSQVAWPVLILFIIVLAVSCWYQAYYISTARELARMVAIQKAPILHHFVESSAGAALIHCFNQGIRFQRKNLDIIDNYSQVTFYNSATMEWLSVRINFLFNLVFFIVLVILVSLPPDKIDPSLAGLAAMYGLNLNVLQAWVIWNLCNVENKMVSVERILQFSRLSSEAPQVIDECRPAQDWPCNGTIELENLSIQYSPGRPMVLKGISCKFPGMKKIGIVGRTGSGKSTLIQAIFRVVEPSSGRIMIDGLDISHIGLHDLRTRLCIIPQEPTLFQGTIRDNLDPFKEHLDSEIWEVLRNCHLGEKIMQDKRLLDAPVAEDGENWSVGQRQLICLTRAMLKKGRILVFDEATASVDTTTDNLIQKAIQEEASSCTVLSVAHRITSVIDNDLVLVLHEGKILEYDSPRELLNDKSSSFSKLVNEYLSRSKCN